MSIYDYLTDEKTYHEATTGKHGVYPGSGYIVDMNIDTAKETVELLRQTRWLDVKTRAVFVEYMYYSADLDAFGDTRSVRQNIHAYVHTYIYTYIYTYIHA
jgi:hypothetical protein